VQEEFVAEHKTPLDFFGARREWAISARESRSEQINWSNHNPTISYCLEHDKFTSCTVPPEQREGSCSMCIINRTGLMFVDYVKMAFPTSPFTKEGRMKDRDEYLRLNAEMNKLVAKKEAKSGNKHSEEKAIRDFEPKLLKAWHAYVLQVHRAGEEMRSLFPREKKELTPEETKEYNELHDYIKKGVSHSTDHREGVNVFKIKCLLHNKMCTGVPLCRMDKYDPACDLCYKDDKPLKLSQK